MYRAFACWGLLIIAQTGIADVYSSLGIGWNYAEKLSIGEPSGRIDYDFGLPAASVAVGLEQTNWRFEIEASHQENEPEVLYFRNSDVAVDSRESDALTATSFFLNGFRTFTVGKGFRPYLGAGLGPAHIGLKFRNDATGAVVIDDKTWALALQASAGVDIPVTKKLALSLDYRYWYAPDFTLDDNAGDSQKLSQGIHSGWLRARYRLGEGGGFPPTAETSTPKGWFLDGTIGGGWAVDEDLNGTEIQLDAYSIGPMGSISVGYTLRPGWQLALELARRQNDMQIIDYGAAGELRTEGDVTADSLTMNLSYRFRPNRAVTPYAGAGIGAFRTRYDLTDASDGTAILDDTASGLAFQWWLGFEFKIDENWSARTDYRMWIGNESEFELSDGTRVDARHVAHNMTFGVRYSL